MTASSRPPVIGLVGGIGSGKSAVAAILQDLGCAVSDSDRDSRSALESPEVLQAIREWWGPGVITEDGTPDRSAIAAHIFGNSDDRARLEALIHPKVHAAREHAFSAASPGTRALVIDAPLLFEAEIDGLCDAVVFVDTPEEIRLERVRSNRGWDESEWSRRESAQMSIEEKRARATMAIDNSVEIEFLRPRVEAVLNALAPR
ncbi:MAG: dephospho-CoA kinase [Phycisphaerales bacterium]|nr:dephospho-CoA kinase [Phycisphaerales bacterium]